MKRVVDYSIPAVERFWQDVDRRGPEECWPWNGVGSDQGYGWFRPAANDREKAHRWLLGYLRGEPLRWDSDQKELACHRCDNKTCCNPGHLYVGTASDNQKDRKNGGPVHFKEIPAPVLSAFTMRAEVVKLRGLPEDDCWEWPYSKTSRPRNIAPNMQHRGVFYSVPRMALLVYGAGVTPERPYARHTCGERWCWNPSHLYPSTTSRSRRLSR
ncbi:MULTISPECIES: HNH endonuclease [unclassified Micromonospora]|uniref:HNH endonuclease n=1 Tax=unclassified Micromonospora TaxID=2617518 RepID=UPI00098D1C23|nr:MULTISPECIES: HNH endonuclease [unclassified Micromonospora]MDI5937018.1 HNH endonuclease [Micromonospora sp. DH15]